MQKLYLRGFLDAMDDNDPEDIINESCADFGRYDFSKFDENYYFMDENSCNHAAWYIEDNFDYLNMFGVQLAGKKEKDRKATKLQGRNKIDGVEVDLLPTL